MNTSSHFLRIVSVVAAVSMATVALAQPPPAGGPGSPTPGPGQPGSGFPVPRGRIVIPPPQPPPPPHHYRGRSSKESTVVRVQRALKSRGYYAGPIDGDAGPGTRGAIRSFRTRHGLGSSTRIDGSLLLALGL